MQKLTDQGYPALLYAITNRKDEISFRIRWAPLRPSGKESGLSRTVSHSIAPSTLTTKLLTRERASLRNRKTLSGKCDQFYVDNFSLPVSLAASPHSFSTSPHQVCKFSFCSVEMFTISCSSHLNGWIIWLLVTPVIFFTPSIQLACW